MAALIFILISLTAAVFHGASPVRAEDVMTPTPIVINGDTADVTVGLYADKGRQQPLGERGLTLDYDSRYYLRFYGSSFS